MKFLSLSIVALALAAISPAQAADVVLSKRIAVLNVDISTTKMKFSRAGYTSEVVKVLVPELADVTILDHRNIGEGAPCLASYEALNPQDVIQNNPAVEQIPFEIALIKRVAPNSKGSACDVTLIETVNGKIRGFNFTHDRQKEIGTRNIADCR
jgi:hypothetical protein